MPEQKRAIENMLQHVAIINKKYSDLAKISGENFNIFKILRLESNEVRLHSRLLGELLNPLGDHGLSSTFLTIFLKKLNVTDFTDFEEAEVIIEKHIGSISLDYTAGGQIDIVIRSKDGRGILIENKIYATDQAKQLARYYKYGQENFKNGFKLFYLTLDGRQAWVESLNEITDKIECISYKTHINNWLEECRKEAASYPLVRETIAQYINLINTLTGQSNNNAMENEISALITSSFEHFKSAKLCSEMYLQLKPRIKADLLHDMDKADNFKSVIVENWNGYKLTYNYTNDKNTEFYFYFDGYTQDDKHVKGNDTAFEPLFTILKEINPNFICNDNHIGWIWSKTLPHSFEKLNLETLYNLSDKGFRKEFSAKFIDEGEQYVKRFIEKIKLYQATIV